MSRGSFLPAANLLYGYGMEEEEAVNCYGMEEEGVEL